MANVKGKWFGKCGVCEKEDEQLATVKVATGINMNYSVIRACDDCRSIIHNVVEDMLMDLRKK